MLPPTPSASAKNVKKTLYLFALEVFLGAGESVPPQQHAPKDTGQLEEKQVFKLSDEQVQDAV